MACYVIVVTSKDPRDRATGPGAWRQLQGAVSVDERRPEHPAADPPRRDPADVQLSPLQKAWVAYREHTAGCDRCRTRDGGRCEEAAAFWAAHQKLCDDIYAALAAERGRARF